MKPWKITASSLSYREKKVCFPLLAVRLLSLLGTDKLIQSYNTAPNFSASILCADSLVINAYLTPPAGISQGCWLGFWLCKVWHLCRRFTRSPNKKKIAEHITNLQQWIPASLDLSPRELFYHSGQWVGQKLCLLMKWLQVQVNVCLMETLKQLTCFAFIQTRISISGMTDFSICSILVLPRPQGRVWPHQEKWPKRTESFHLALSSYFPTTLVIIKLIFFFFFSPLFT